MIIFNDWLLLPERAAVHVPTETAVVADLHLGYNEARRRSGEAIPRIALHSELLPLEKALARKGLRRLVVAGDLLEAGFCPSVVRSFTEWLKRANLDLIAVVPGNHDRHLNQSPFPLQPEGVKLGKWRVIHGDDLSAERAGESLVHGHWHPAMPWQGRKRPAFMFRPGRLVLPAYSQDAAGVTPRQVPEGRSFHRAVIVGQRIVAVPAAE